MARLGQCHTEPSLPVVTTVTDSKIEMRVSCHCPFPPRHGYLLPTRPLHAVEILRGMFAGNVSRKERPFGAHRLRELPAGAAGSGAGAPGSARTCTPIGSRKPVLS